MSRRDVLVAAAVTAGAAAIPLRPSRAAAKFTRPNVTSEAGQKMLAIYAKGVEAMLKLPADHPHNWFRNAFVHMMDCPHGNWWFYVWHRGYIGYFEQTIRTVTKEDSFVLPYWDWTQLPQIPDGMFDDCLTPSSAPFLPYTGSVTAFTNFMKPALTTYWSGFSPAQLAQQAKRGYKKLDDVWSDILGYAMCDGNPVPISQNQAFVITGGARYLTRDNPKLDDKTAANVEIDKILGGLSPEGFNVTEQNGDTDAVNSFTSSHTKSHHVPPPGRTVFSTLEGFPHNKVHNYIGGYGSLPDSDLQPGPFGNMTNNLSPVDPIFFLHHANMDRLWDVWTRKQVAMGLSPNPSDADKTDYFGEPFLFFIDGKGDPIVAGKAEDYFDKAVFDYDYEPGSGEQIIPQTSVANAEPLPLIRSAVAANIATLTVPRAAVQGHLAAGQARLLVAAVTMSRPMELAGPREFDVLVNAPEGVTHVSADSPYYAGTFALFGAPMPGMHMHGDLTFSVPLPRRLQAFTALAAGADAKLQIRVVPSHGEDKRAVVLKAVSLSVR
ncbi:MULTISPECIES: tyrosinase family protein [Inquilinus]|uniref:Tyrosinase n=1 Tax=Inquilinus ginsengisoli TaxID=363840 RepID=A0ABU1JZJ1_9PROT|nr:tyrosinase family protein [Inquilinus ginsengisoli]MDR6294047.1 tyrosinase [Inquilinus ginsengisoli]